ncbi:hypothetical protein [Bacillus mycoides]|uniref:hypothetical protein n=1 Tax=Bacillus mycoides TaxID=1405 RepID=UPI00027C197E|nr:hypothetical protein [Bacillus mycoides]EJV59378.1 hypothetical protein IEU_05643 [Bacillus mycoides]
MIDQRRQQDDFIASVIKKAQEGNSNNLLVGRTIDVVDPEETAIRVDFDYYSTTSSMIMCSMLSGARDSLIGLPANQKVLVGYFGNFYVIIDLIL